MEINKQDKPKVDIASYTGKSVSEFFLNLFSHIFDLRDGLDRKGTIDRIKSNIEMQGANVWLLICSIFVASLGLDLNSSAVIIGAMLISPLMSPILGIGLAVGIYDRKLLTKSLINYGIALFIALLTSIIYFLVTPFGTETPEIMARTQPHLLDVAVAFFGGTAGIVATSRKDLINAVPGVAIATALMPPVCVAGFGIANANLNIFAGAFYLFFLNTVFVALATYLIVRLLRYPYKEYLNAVEKRRNQLYVFLFAGIVAIPSIIKMLDVIGDITTQNRIETYINNSFKDYDGEIQDIKVSNVRKGGKRGVSVYLYGSPINAVTEQMMDTHIQANLCDNCETLDLNYSSVEMPDMGKFGSDLEHEYTMKLNYATEKIEQNFSNRLDSIEQVMLTINTAEPDTTYTSTLVEKLAIVVPELEVFSFGEVEEFNMQADTSYMRKVALVSFSKALRTSDKKKAIQQVQDFVKAETGYLVEVKED